MDRKTASALEQYRNLRTQCLERLSGTRRNSVSGQLSELLTLDGAFRMLNEARRLEHGRKVSSITWRLTTTGYIAALATGIRRLVDTGSNTASLTQIVNKLRGNIHLLTRAHYVCHDGDPYDWEQARDAFFREHLDGSSMESGAVIRDRIDWSWSRIKHAKFDELSEEKAEPQQRMSHKVLESLDQALRRPPLQRIKTFTDKSIAHADWVVGDVPGPTLDDIEESLKIACQVRNFISSVLFFDSDQSHAVPTPQFDISEHLDEPLALPETRPQLQEFWRKCAEERNQWSSADSGYAEQFLL